MTRWMAMMAALLLAKPGLGVEPKVEKVLVEIKSEKKGQLKVSVKNKMNRPIGLIRFTLENHSESGEITFEDIPLDKTKSRLIKVRSNQKMNIKNVVVVDDEAVTQKPQIKVFRR